MIGTYYASPSPGARPFVEVGDIIKTYAQVNWAGRTSMEVGVTVSVQRLLDDYDVLVMAGGAEAPRDLVAKLGNTLRYERAVEIVVEIHCSDAKACREIDGGAGLANLMVGQNRCLRPW